MNIQSIYHSGAAAATVKTAEATKVNTAAAQTEQASKGSQTETKKVTDTIKISEEGRATESKKLDFDQLMALQDQRVASFKNMLASMFQTQAGRAGSSTPESIKFTKDLFSKMNITPAASADAAQSISADGEWGVDAVAGRVMDMAVSLSGGDSSKFAVLKDAFEKGFAAAEKQWGGKLPGISYDTQKEIQNRFDYLEKNGSMDGYGMKTGDE